MKCLLTKRLTHISFIPFFLFYFANVVGKRMEDESSVCRIHCSDMKLVVWAVAEC